MKMCGVSFTRVGEVPPTKKDGGRESLTVEGKMSVGATCMRVSLKGPTGLDVVGILEE